MKKDLNNYRDADGFLGDLDENGNLLDFGDSAQRTFSEGFLDDTHSGEYALKYDKIRKSDGELVRHPNSRAWYGQRGTMSWDQLLPVILCLGKHKLYGRLRSLLWTLIKRGWFAWNTKKIGERKERWWAKDFLGVVTVIAFIRAFRAKWLYPVLFVLDFWLILHAFGRVMASYLDDYSSFKDNDVGPDLNTTNLMLQIEEGLPTPFGMAAHRLYFTKRDDVEGQEGPAVLQAFKHYARHKENVPMWQLYEARITRASE